MITVDKALNIILNSVKPLEAERVKLIDALERVLAEDIYAGSDIPGFDNSAMDGYAVRSSDIKGASKDNPKTLEVIYDLKAGDVPKKKLKAGQAVRIMTGAMLPKGADSVVMVEDTKIKSEILNPKSETNPNPKILNSKQNKKEYVEIFKEVKIGENVRRHGEDIKKGEKVFTKGTLLNCGSIGLLASLGRPNIKVAKKPRVAILATGDEVIDVNKKLTPGKLYSSNSYTLYSQVLKCGCIPKNLGIAKDRPKELEKKIRQGLDCDIILTSGGVSVGDYDLVKDILVKIGIKLKLWRVAMRPGKPLAFGTIKDKLVFGLPGNPVSSMVSFELFTRPAILKMLDQDYDKKEVKAILTEDITKKKGLKYFLRANTQWKDNHYYTHTTGPQGSGILKSMAVANSLIVLPEQEEFVKKGSSVLVRFLD